MNKRTTILLTLMGCVGAAMIGDQLGLLDAVANWGRGHDMAMDRVAKQISVAEDLIVQHSTAADELINLEQFSLPYDPELARSRYQDWLLTLVEVNGLEQVSVDAPLPTAAAITDRGSKKKKEVYKRYTFSLQGRGTLRQVTKVLYDFYQGGYLHKITTLNLVPLGGGRQIDLRMTVEALGLATCDRKSALPEVFSQRLRFAKFEDYVGIVRRSPFSPNAGSILQDVRLTAVTFDKSGTPEAWFSVGSNGTTQKVRRQESISVPAHDIVIIDILPDAALVEVDGEPILLPLGKSVQEAMPEAVASK